LLNHKHMLNKYYTINTKKTYKKMKFFKNTTKIRKTENGGSMKLKTISQTDIGYLKLLIDLITLMDETKKEKENNPETSRLILN